MVIRFLPLGISVVFAAVMAVLALTPLAWSLMGRPDETYPELFYLGFGVPPAIILLGASAVIALLGSQKQGGALRPTLRPLWLCMVVTAAVASLLLTPIGNIIPEGTGQAVIDYTFFGAWPVLAVWVIAGSIWAWTGARSVTSP